MSAYNLFSASLLSRKICYITMLIPHSKKIDKILSVFLIFSSASIALIFCSITHKWDESWKSLNRNEILLGQPSRRAHIIQIYTIYNCNDSKKCGQQMGCPVPASRFRLYQLAARALYLKKYKSFFINSKYSGNSI